MRIREFETGIFYEMEPLLGLIKHNDNAKNRPRGGVYFWLVFNDY